MTTAEPPSPSAIRAYLDTSGWTRHPGPSWSRDGRYAEAPDDATPDEVREILAAVARAEGRSAADVIGSVEALAKLSAPSLPSPSPAPREGVAAATEPFRADLAALREQVEAALDRSIDRCARCKVCDAQINAVMAAVGAEFDRMDAALEHAQAAAAGSHEGVRLWMLDCGELVAKHRERADAAEAKLAEIAEHCRTRPELAGAGYPQLAADILAIIGSEEGATPLRTSDQWAVAWGSEDVNDGIGRVEEYDDQEDAAEHLGLYGDGACVVSREVRWGPWRRVPAADDKEAPGA